MPIRERAHCLPVAMLGRIRQLRWGRRTPAKRPGPIRQKECASSVYTSASGPVLSPILSCSTPALCRIVSSKFAMGVSSGYFRCRPPFSLPAAPRRQHDRQRRMIVNVAVAHAASVQHQRVIEQRAVAVRVDRSLSSMYASRLT